MGNKLFGTKDGMGVMPSELGYIILIFHHCIVPFYAKEINSLGNDLFLDDLHELVIHLELLIQFVEGLFIVCGISCGRDGRIDEVKGGQVL